MLEVVSPGLQTSVQSLPGRLGQERFGVSAAGPMDALSLELANALVGNPVTAPGLEVTLGRFEFTATIDTRIAVTGAVVDVFRDDEPAAQWEALEVPAGSAVRIGMATTLGIRVYIAVEGGIDVPEVLGSTATNLSTGMGGFEGRALKRGDRIPIGTPTGGTGLALSAEMRPSFRSDWDLEIVMGPHAAPDFLLDSTVKELPSLKWKADRNSNRTGIRLTGKPLGWARKGGGIAGGHPSNILDFAYPLGSVNMNGDTPVIIGPEGPTSGGLVVIGVVTTHDMWKIGQIRPGIDTVRFVPVSIEHAQRDRARRIEEQFTERAQ